MKTKLLELALLVVVDTSDEKTCRFTVTWLVGGDVALSQWACKSLEHSWLVAGCRRSGKFKFEIVRNLFVEQRAEQFELWLVT